MAGPQQKPRGSKGYFRPHPTYIPKNATSSSPPATLIAAASGSSDTSAQPAPSGRKPISPLTTSLRSIDTAKTTAEKGNGGGGGSSYLRYLPQDEAVASGFGADAGGLDAVESQAVVNLLNDELSRLLKLKPRDFWREVAKNESLHQFLDSYLQFRSRWYDFPHRGSKGMVAGVIVGEVDLCRRVFLVLYRISSNRDPGASASDFLSIKDHTALLQERKLLDLPKLLDICAIYGHENGELTKLLVSNAINAQPQLLGNLGGVVSHLLSIVRTMHDRCNTSMEVLISSGGGGSNGLMQLSNDFLEVMDFINDAVATFDAFADAYRPATLHFCLSFETSYGNDDLLKTCARLHDSLIPCMLRGFSISSNADEDKGQRLSGRVNPDIVLSLKVLSTRIVKFGWKLLDSCYLNDELTDDNLLTHTSKMFPASVEDPSIRGDILVQTLKEINGDSQFQVDYHDLGTFTENIEKNYKIFSRINNLCSQGWISLDKEQLQYLSRILKTSSPISFATEPLVAISSKINQLQLDEDAALLDSKISQIKDLFPDYGKGFLKACLEVYNHDTEEVIGRILEGRLHEDLLSLDTSMEHIPPANQVSHSGKDKGKALMVEPSSEKNLTSDQAYVGGSSASQPSLGRYTRKSNDDELDSKVLDSRSAKDAVRSAILASEIEYEDEYDDSFDDLGLSAVDSGFEEPESLIDRTNLLSGKSSEPDQNSSSRWNSQKKPLYYVKDGKNYSYKVSGSVGVASAKEAAIWNQTQKDLIHGLGRGGNLPLGAAQNLEEDSEKEDDQISTPTENSGRGNSSFRGRGGRRGGGNHHRKDRAMKKHFSGLTGY